MCAAFSAGDLLRCERTAVKGTAACGCAVFRGKPNSGEESIESDGTGSGTASFPAHGDDTGECREACRSDEKLRNKVSIKEQMTPAEVSRKAIRPEYVSAPPAACGTRSGQYREERITYDD